MQTRTPILFVVLVCLLGTSCTTYASYRPSRLNPSGERTLLERRATDPIRASESYRGRGPSAWLPLAADVHVADGLTLAEAGSIALRYAPDVLRRRAEVRIKGAQLCQAGRMRDVELFLGPRVGLHNAGFVLPGSVQWEIPLGGERRAERGLASCDLQVARLEIIAAELDALVAVREHFIAYAATQHQLAIQQASKSQADGLLLYIEQLLEAGEADPIAVHLARLERDETERQLEETMSELPVRRAGLLRLIGLLPSAPIEIIADDATFSMPLLPSPSPTSILAHPKLQAAAAVFRAADQAARLAVAKQYPTLAIGPDFELDRGDLEIGAGIGLKVPNAWRQKAVVCEAIERRRAAKLAYHSALLRLSQEQAESRAQVASLDRLLLSHSQRLESASNAEVAIDKRSAAGLVVPVEAITARSAISRARVREMDLLKRRALATLRAASAGGLLLVTPVEPPLYEGSN